MGSAESFTGARLPSEDLEQNIRYFRDLFTDDGTLVFRQLENRKNRQALRFCLLYSDGMVDNKLMNQDVIRPLLEFRFEQDREDGLMDIIRTQAVFANDAKQTDGVEDLIQGIVYGDTVLLVDGCPSALVLNTKGFTLRSISEPESERVIRGPREGFNESILTNLSMLRRRLRTPDLKIGFMTFGRRTKTKACICYLEALVNRDVLAELKRRLETVDIDGILDSHYITELVQDSSFSAVKTVGSTEKPDVVAAKLLEGRVALFVDGSPVVLTVPHLFIEHFQSDEDYYINYVFTSIGRLLRIASFFVSISAPAIYVALVAFHQEMLPTPLLLSIAAARQGVPFPTALETLMMLVVFEMLRESGTRMPGIMGQTLSIVGALIIGQAAVNAKIVSAPIIIVVSITGICGLMVPRLKGYIIVHRFLLLGCSCILGLYGYLLGIIAMLVGLFGLTSFGIPILAETYAKNFQDFKDLWIRAPMEWMIQRPKFLTKNRVRQSAEKDGK